MRPRILFTSPCKPFERLWGGFLPSDQMSYSLTRGQGIFSTSDHTHFHALHLLAQNISPASVLLEYPTLDHLATELKQGYDYVCISVYLNNLDALLEMTELIRRVSPDARIIVGGYGVICRSLLDEDPAWRGKVDAFCSGEGIAYLRSLLDEPADARVFCQLPKGGFSLPWLNPRSAGNTGVILSGLGCTQRCPFCNTSAYTGGRYVEVMDAAQIYRVMRDYWSHSPFTDIAILYDENFLDNQEKAEALGTLLREDEGFGLRRLNYASYASLNALARYDPEQLLLLGVDKLVVGVESKFSPLPKRQGLAPEEAFRMLHSIGVKTFGSWIIGEDYQTPENIQEDMDFLVSLDPTYQQLNILFVSPTLPLWKRLKKEHRIPAEVPWKEYNIFGRTFDHNHFSHEKMLECLESMYERIYQENGPAVMKDLEVNLNGYETCLESRNPTLNGHKIELFRRRCETYYPLVRTGLAYAPSDRARSRIERLAHRFRGFFERSHISRLDRLGERILKRADREMARREREPPLQPEEPFRRYVYPPLEERDPRCPYRVAYPEQ